MVRIHKHIWKIDNNQGHERFVCILCNKDLIEVERIPTNTQFITRLLKVGDEWIVSMSEVRTGYYKTRIIGRFGSYNKAKIFRSGLYKKSITMKKSIMR